MNIMSENIKCPRCGYNGSMNRFSSLEHTKLNNSELGSPKKPKIVVEHYCPKCKSWVII